MKEIKMTKNTSAMKVAVVLSPPRRDDPYPTDATTRPVFPIHDNTQYAQAAKKPALLPKASSTKVCGPPVRLLLALNPENINDKTIAPKEVMIHPTRHKEPNAASVGGNRKTPDPTRLPVTRETSVISPIFDFPGERDKDVIYYFIDLKSFFVKVAGHKGQKKRRKQNFLLFYFFCMVSKHLK
jgi:hypothetical protein